MYLLDTNHCSMLLAGHPGVVEKLVSLGDTPVATCVIVCGELIFMAHKSDRRAENLQRVHTFLNSIAMYPVDLEAADIYGRVKSGLLDRFGPRERARRRRTTIEQLGFTENDLWLTAIALQHGLTVVSGDSNFARIRQVERLAVETWIAL